MASNCGKPNIVFIHTDSMDGRLMGCMGHPAMRAATPNLDRLASRGVLFRNAYSNCPLCCPSRSSMWSGRYVHRCEAWNNYKGLSPADATFRTRLDAAGYRTRAFGKTDHLSGRHTARARVLPWTRAARIMRPGYRMAAPHIVERDQSRVHQSDWNDVDRGIEWLWERSREGDSPFMLFLGLRQPHPEFLTSRTYLDVIDETEIDIPKPDGTEHPVLEYQRVVKNWRHGFSDGEVRQVRRIYLAMIAEVDAMVGAVLEAMEEFGLDGSTYVIFSSDHGELAMEHRQFYKMSPYEPSVRVPLIVQGPGLQRGTEVTKPVSLVDVHPTLMDMAELERPQGLDGHSLMPELTGGTGGRPGWVFSEFHGSTCDTGVFVARRGRWKYIAYAGYDPMLFDLEDDPDEIHDLARDRPAVVRDMEALLAQIVDYEAVDARAKAHDKRAFRRWRDGQMAMGRYERMMARIYSGWDDLTDDAIQPWSLEDEAAIRAWLEGG